MDLASAQLETGAALCAPCAEEAARRQPGPTPLPIPVVDLTGQTVGECRLLARLGVSEFGVVYRARDETLDRTVAIKVFPESLSADAGSARAFVRHAVTAAQLSHPGIVAVHKVGKDDRLALHYVVMEYVDGSSLADVVALRGPMPWRDALPLMLQACDAVAYAHEEHVIHKELRPENLLLDVSGRLRVADFGLSACHSALALPDEVWGSHRHMAPEQLAGVRPDARSDIYSLGVCFYHLLSGALPFDDPHPKQVIHLKRTSSPPPLASVSPSTAEGVCAVVDRMISTSREDRYASLREVIAALQPGPGGGPPAAPPPPRSSTLGPEGSTSTHEAMPAPCEDASGYLFVSYKRGEEPRIAWMLHRMRELGVPVWYDRGLTPGGDWFAEILEHLEAARAYVVFLTKDSVQSRHVDNEVKHAYQCGMPILPVRLEEVNLPKGLRFVLNNVQWIDASGDRDRTRSQLDRAIRALPSSKG